MVAGQRVAAPGIAQQVEGREMGQVEAVLEDRRGLDAAIGQEGGAAELGQAITVLGPVEHLSLHLMRQHEREFRNSEHDCLAGFVDHVSGRTKWSRFQHSAVSC